MSHARRRTFALAVALSTVTLVTACGSATTAGGSPTATTSHVPRTFPVTVHAANGLTGPQGHRIDSTGIALPVRGGMELAVTVEYKLRGGPLGRIVDALIMRRMLARVIGQSLAKLKTLAEA